MSVDMEKKNGVAKTEQEMVDENVKIDWPYRLDLFLFCHLTISHIGGAIGLYLAITSASWKTLLFAFVLDRIGMVAITAGAHRLWSHRAYKATLTLRILLMLLYTSTFLTSIIFWVRDHRVHHKYVDTDADPYNSRKGFLFSQIAWVCHRRHPACKARILEIDIQDLLADPVVMFQKRYYYPLAALCCFIIPTVIPMYFWGETFSNAFFVAGYLRMVLNLHEVGLVNSAAHMWGNKPYDSNIFPAENKWVSIFAGGEGFHNYHHVFPYDYAASELGWKHNLSTMFIDLMAWCGLAYDLKTAPKSTIQARIMRNIRENPENCKASVEKLQEASKKK